MEHKINFSDSEFGTLLGPEETSGPPGWGWVFFLAASGLGRLTHSCDGAVVATVCGCCCVVGGCGGGCGVGVWLCVECCIVDASILLCVSV